MAIGRLSAVECTANANTTLYTVPVGQCASLSLNLCNRDITPATVRVALAASDTPTNAEWFEYDTSLAANAPLERTGIVLAAGQKLVVFTTSANVSAQVYGYERAA